MWRDVSRRLLAVFLAILMIVATAGAQHKHDTSAPCGQCALLPIGRRKGAPENAIVFQTSGGTAPPHERFAFVQRQVQPQTLKVAASRMTAQLEPCESWPEEGLPNALPASISARAPPAR